MTALEHCRKNILVHMFISHSDTHIVKLRLSDFVAGRKRSYNLSRGLCILASKYCRKIEI